MIINQELIHVPCISVCFEYFLPNDVLTWKSLMEELYGNRVYDVV